MKLRRRIVDAVEPRCRGVDIKDIRIGLRYLAVQLEDGRTGVAHTLARTSADACVTWPGDRQLASKSASDLLLLLASSDPLESALGLATTNAVANTDPEDAVMTDVLDAVSFLPTDRVAMVGFFAPLVSGLRKQVSILEIFEETAKAGEDLRPASEAPAAICQSDVAIITSTAIVNDTMDSLLNVAAECRETILLGPSTPFVPEAFTETSVTWLSGIAVRDGEELLRIVSQAGGTRLFKPFVSKWNVALKAI